MKNIKYILIIIFLVKSLNIFSQGEFVIEIDRANGTFIKTGPEIAGITYIYPNTRAYDENNGLFIFPSADNPTRLYSIDVNNDSIIYSPVYNNLLVEFEFCNSTNTMYGLLKDNLSNVKFLASIDPKTGISTVIGDTIPDSGTFSGLSAFDQTNNRYIYLDGANKIVSIDASHGNIVSNPILVLEGSEYLVSMSCDETNEILNGMIFNSTENKNYFVSINTSTGAVIKIGSGMTLGNIGSSAIDQNNGQFIFLYENSIGSYAIATVNISTGELVYNNLIQTFDLDNLLDKISENGIESRYNSKKELQKESLALMQGRLERMKSVSEADILRAKLMQLKFKMEDYLKNTDLDY